jgi:hypothetical protein
MSLKLLEALIACACEVIIYKREDAMTKAECKMKLKHQLELGRRLQKVGLHTAAAESRNKAHLLLQFYKRHFLEEPAKHH